VLLGGLGRSIGHRENGAGDRTGDRPPGRDGHGPEQDGDQRPRRSRPQASLLMLQGAADAGEHLSQDRARVAVGRQDRGLHDRVETGPVHVRHLGDPGQGQFEVGAGIGVRHRNTFIALSASADSEMMAVVRRSQWS
jgi:hypothetical protein